MGTGLVRTAQEDLHLHCKIAEKKIMLARNP
jgi:hypothetical protein